MTRSLALRSFRSNRRAHSLQRRDPAVEKLGFTCYRLVPTIDGMEPMELWQSTSRMFAFVGR